MTELLEEVIWDRTALGDPISSVWDGISGKFTPKKTFSLAGPKEVGHAVAAALVEPASRGGRQIRGGQAETASSPVASTTAS